MARAPLPELVASEPPVTFSVAPEAALTLIWPPTVLIEPVLSSVSVPPLTAMGPVKVLALESVSVPVPFLVRPAVPAITELMVSEALFTVIVGPPRVRVPPESTMAPEALPKVSVLALTVPDTVIVPAAKPSVAVPKFNASEVVVVTLAPGAATPVESELH